VYGGDGGGGGCGGGSSNNNNSSSSSSSSGVVNYIAFLAIISIAEIYGFFIFLFFFW